MPVKEYHRIRRLREGLAKAKVTPELLATIMEGGDAVRDDSSPGVKSRWMADAMERMDALLDYDTRRRVRESCSCCLGGKRREAMLAVARAGGSTEERLAGVERAGIVVPVARLEDDGRILVRYGPEGPASFDCPCLRESEVRLSLTYCQCCGGHVRRHLETALERKLSCEVVASILNSGGQEMCTFRLTLVV